MSKDRLPAPPSHLSADAKRLFRDVVKRYDLDAEELVSLRLACTAWDTAEKARRTLDREGQTITNRFDEPRAHPALAVQKEAMASWVRLMQLLGIPADDEPQGRDTRGRWGSRGAKA